MGNFDDLLDEHPRKKTKTRAPKITGKDLKWNVLTGVMILLTLCACGVIFSLLQNPYSRLNPFAPSTIVPPPATLTWTPVAMAATWTHTPTLPPTETSTPRPTYTIEPSSTAFKVSTSTPNYTPTKGPTVTRTPRPTGSPYMVTVTYNQSTTFRVDTSCSSMYVAGQALDANNKPITGLVVKLGGSLAGKTYLPENNTTLTGINAIYGQSGFEFDLKTAPVASYKTLWVQLYDISGTAFSEQYKLITYADCARNLILLRFQQRK